MILRGQGLSMTFDIEDICNSRVAFVTEKGSKLLDVGTKYRYRKNKKCKHLHF